MVVVGSIESNSKQMTRMGVGGGGDGKQLENKRAARAKSPRWWEKKSARMTLAK